jgi:glutaredoxin-related protein
VFCLVCSLQNSVLLQSRGGGGFRFKSCELLMNCAIKPTIQGPSCHLKLNFSHWLGKMTGRATVPHIFINGTSYGGCMDGPGLVPLYEDGRLQKLLKKAGAL